MDLLSKGGHQKAGSGHRAPPSESGNELHAEKRREKTRPKQRLGCKGL